MVGGGRTDGDVIMAGGQFGWKVNNWGIGGEARDNAAVGWKRERYGLRNDGEVHVSEDSLTQNRIEEPQHFGYSGFSSGTVKGSC